MNNTTLTKQQFIALLEYTKQIRCLYCCFIIVLASQVPVGMMFDHFSHIINHGGYVGLWVFKAIDYVNYAIAAAGILTAILTIRTELNARDLITTLKKDKELARYL